MLCVKLCEADIALSHLKKNANISFEKTQKVWHIFIKAFLFRITNYLRWKCSHSPDVLYQILLQSNKFIELSKQHLNITKFKIVMDPGYKPLKYYGFQSVFNNNDKVKFYFTIQKVIYATGKMYLLHPVISIGKTYMFFFNLDKTVNLNITFHKIIFFKNPQKCDKAGLRIYTKLQENKSYIFCGYYSTLNFYPNFETFTMEFLFYRHLQLLPFEFNASFAVIDTNFVTNVHSSNSLNLSMSKTFTNLQAFYSYKLQKKITAISYSIKASKVYKIVFPSLNLFSFTYFVFDGPGFTSPILTANNKITTSTFQCILQFLFVTKFIPRSGNISFTFQPQNMDLSKNITTPKGLQRYFSLAHTANFNRLSMILLQAQQGFQVNVTVLNIFSSFTQSSDCTDWGFLIVEHLDGKYEESITLCSKHNGSSVPSRSFYSVNSTLIMLLYSYPGIQQLNISGVISTTQCKTIYFDPCTYYLSAKQCKSVFQFKSYLKNIQKFLKIHLTKQRAVMNYNVEDIFVSLLEEQCIVIQIGYKALDFIHLHHDDFYHCLATYMIGCHTRVSTPDTKSIISAVKGHLSEEKISIKPNQPSVVSISNLNNNSNVIKNEYDLENATFNLHLLSITSVNIRLAFLSRMLNWIDIVISERTQHYPKYLQHVANLHDGLNRLPSIRDQGLKPFSDGDIALKLSNSSQKQIPLLTLLYDMPLMVEIKKSFMLHHLNYFVSQGMHFEFS